MIRNIYYLLIFFLMVSASYGRPPYYESIDLTPIKSDTVPYKMVVVHNVGKMALTITNYGIIGRQSDLPVTDPLTGQLLPSLSYPPGMGLNYLYEAGLWVGAIVGRDALVSTACGADYGVHEFWPDSFPGGQIQYRSNNNPELPEYEGAISQQDYIAVYYDTLTDPNRTGYDYYSRHFHRPLGIKIIQKSYAWGYDYADDFVLFDLEIINIGINDLKQMYVGLYIDNDIGKDYKFNNGDDICGFRRAVPSRYIARLVDTINIVWAADNDGDYNPISGAFMGLYSPTSAVATRILRTPLEYLHFNFNWWISSNDPKNDWGPRRAGTPSNPFRSFNGYLGTPVGDANKYYIMSHEEFDYDQRETYIDHSASGWLPPPANADQITDGADIRYLLS
ncbi:MAG: hypothetical protein NTV06_08965, partial [candidate division Zixibacteria bacterium]|nr:hypothetical protein [candidate division Zixibacteria bacterium]